MFVPLFCIFLQFIHLYNDKSISFIITKNPMTKDLKPYNNPPRGIINPFIGGKMGMQKSNDFPRTPSSAELGTDGT